MKQLLTSRDGLRPFALPPRWAGFGDLVLTMLGLVVLLAYRAFIRAGISRDRATRRDWRAGVVILASIGSFLMPRVALAQGENTLVVAAGQHIDGSVATVTQDIRVDGVVAGDVTSWSGTITIVGTVGGDVVSYGGAVRVLATGRVDGHILASGGALQKDPRATVAGQTIHDGGGSALASLLDLFAPSPGADSAGPFGRTLFGVALGVLLLAFCLLCAALWPRRVLLAGATLRRLPGRALLLGLITTLAAGLALLPLAGLLIASVIGLPFLLVLLALLLIPPIYGLTVLAHIGGARFASPMSALAGLDLPVILVALTLVLAIVVAAALAPAWGLALFYLVASPGLGAAILSRGGTVTPLMAR
jgi:cytoskeletal protein CcmA (bactofilin family)